ncbi:fimbrillin family protein [Bacteroides caecigallinarum]|nr:fimbrillin family protein [Bacteroides caecigallinarum]
MKHKSNIITFVLAVVLLGSSCTSVITEVSTDETHAISFQTPKTRTRAAIDDATDMTDGFSVWGWYRKTDAGPHNVFDGVTVKLDNGSWKYDETQYWIPGWTYDFYAVHPVFSADGPVASVASDGTISVTNFDCSKTGAEAIDFMIAQKTGIPYTGDTPPSPVDLKFGHELAKVSFVVVTESGAAFINSNKANLQGVLYKGDYSNKNVPIWTNTAAVTDENVYTNTQLIEASVRETYLLSEMLLIPQKIGGVGGQNAVLNIEYHYGNENSTRSKSINLTEIEWEAGKSYKYTLTIESDGRIHFASPTVVPWGEATGGVIIIE